MQYIILRNDLTDVSRTLILLTTGEFLIERYQYSKYQYLEFVDRGSLKLPSNIILEAFVTLYKHLVTIDKDNLLISVLVKGRSKIS